MHNSIDGVMVAKGEVNYFSQCISLRPIYTGQLVLPCNHFSGQGDTPNNPVNQFHRPIWSCPAMSP